MRNRDILDRPETGSTISLEEAGQFNICLPVRSLTIWMDSREAAQFLRISVPMLRNMASNGQLPFYKLGRRNRYRRDELEALLFSNRRGPL